MKKLPVGEVNFQSENKKQYKEFWDKVDQLYLPKTYTQELEKSKALNTPCPACALDHSKLKESQMWYGDLFCGWCHEDMINGRPLRRKRGRL